MNQNDYIEIDLREIFFALLRRWWLFLLCLIIAVGTTYTVTFYYLTPVYKAETSLFLGKEKDTIGSITYAQLEINNQLIVDYQQIIKSNLVTEAVISDLNLDMSVSEFKSRVGVEIIEDSRLFIISFESTNPQLAADVANTLAGVIVEKAAEIIDVKNVKVIDIAKVPTAPVKPNKIKNLILAAAAGIILACVLVFIMEMLDHTFKKQEDVEKKLGINVLGNIPRFAGSKKKKDKKGKSNAKKGDQNLIALIDPKSSAAEAYRALRTNLHYTSIDKPLKTLVITSPGPEDGKSTTACNLAISLAQNGEKVLLIDADLRKAKIHKYFDLPNQIGLTNILADNVEPEDAFIGRTDIDNLTMISSGPVPPNPAELLGSNKMKTLLDEFKKQFDVIIIDTPPVLNVTDSSILGGIADGILLVVSAGETNIEIARKALKAILNIGTKILGASLVKVNTKGLGAYYRYYSYEYK